jgi:cytochrome c-type biogenesis protein CcmH/NrfG
MAETALQRSDLVTAERLAKKAALADPDQPEYGALLAWILAMSGRPGVIESSISRLNAILQEDTTCETALLYRGKLFKRADRKTEAVRDFESVLEVNPKNREAASELRLLRTVKKK